MMNPLKIIIFTFYRIINILNLKLKKIEIGESYKMNGLLYLKNKGKIKIGSKFRINSGYSTNPIGGDCRSRLATARKDALLEIGNNVGISNSTLIAWNRIILEDDVIIGGNCKIYDTDFHPLNFNERRTQNPSQIDDVNIISKEVIIKRGAFIGAHSIILKGSIIGENSIIGAGSVVSKKIPKNQIWGGNPASFIKNI